MFKARYPPSAPAVRRGFRTAPPMPDPRTPPTRRQWIAAHFGLGRAGEGTQLPYRGLRCLGCEALAWLAAQRPVRLASKVCESGSVIRDSRKSRPQAVAIRGQPCQPQMAVGAETLALLCPRWLIACASLQKLTNVPFRRGAFSRRLQRLVRHRSAPPPQLGKVGIN
jgi:hypothetical protein